MSTLDLLKLGAFGRQICNIIPGARDLELLDQIGQTVEAIADETIKFQSIALMTEHYVEILQKASLSSTDALIRIEEILPQCIATIGKYYDIQVAKRQCAIEDRRLTEEDGIVDAYDALLEEISSFYNSLSTLSWIVGEHNAEADVALPGTFSSADALFEAMGV